MRHPDDDRDLSDLFARLFAVWQPPVGWDVLGVGPDDRIDGAALPAPFARVLGYVGRRSSASPCPRSIGAATSATRPTSVPRARRCCWPARRRSRSPITTALAFRLGRALTYLLPGRAVAGALPSRQLKQTVLAAMTLAQSSLRVDDADGEIKAIRVAISAAAPALGRELAPICERIVAGTQATLNLGALRPRPGAHRRPRGAAPV